MLALNECEWSPIKQWSMHPHIQQGDQKKRAPIPQWVYKFSYFHAKGWSDPLDDESCALHLVHFLKILCVCIAQSHARKKGKFLVSFHCREGQIIIPMLHFLFTPLPFFNIQIYPIVSYVLVLYQNLCFRVSFYSWEIDAFVV